MVRLLAATLIALVALVCVGAPFAEARSSMLRKQGVEARVADPSELYDDEDSWNKLEHETDEATYIHGLAQPPPSQVPRLSFSCSFECSNGGGRVGAISHAGCLQSAKICNFGSLAFQKMEPF